MHRIRRVRGALVFAAALTACSGPGMAEDGGDGGSSTADGDAGTDACAAPFRAVTLPPSSPPYAGTSFISDDLITAADPTSFVDLTYTGQGVRSMYDRRTASFDDVDAHLFDARFGSSTIVEIQVNPEMSRTEAEAEARYYAAAIGRIPGFLFRDIATVWIHRGMNPFGGGNRNLLVHTEQGAAYARDGALEEIFIHEASHTSMDSYHASAPRWMEARVADGVAISTYARDDPGREDVAESVGPYLAVRFGGDRVAAGVRTTIEATIPSRIQYLDCLGLTMDILR